MALQAQHPDPTSFNVWLGATDLEKEGEWRWVTGEEIDYGYFSEGEPNNWDGVDERCMSLFNIDMIVDAPCEMKAVPACQWPSHDSDDLW